MNYPEETPGISISELMSRLKLSRNYIIRNITHCVEHIEYAPAQGTRVIYDEAMLRRYLEQKATFTRQTRRINIEKELEKYRSKHPEDKRVSDGKFCKEFIGNIPNWNKITRSQLPNIPLPSDDFWDFPLIFPKEYTQGNNAPDAKRKSAEICYRDMFKIGAIKIQLGRQKTMFYIPSEPDVSLPPLSQLSQLIYNDENCFLVPADWKPFYQGHKAPSAQTGPIAKVQISITTDEESFDQTLIETALRKGFALNHILDHTVNSDKNLVTVVYQASTLSGTAAPASDKTANLIDADEFMQDYEQSLEALYQMEDGQ